MKLPTYRFKIMMCSQAAAYPSCATETAYALGAIILASCWSLEVIESFVSL
jgi:hypothetical protein